MSTRNVFGSLAIMGLIGLTATLALNVVALFAFHRASAHPFIGKWWSDWFVNYVVWTTMALIGCAGRTCSRA